MHTTIQALSERGKTRAPPGVAAPEKQGLRTQQMQRTSILLVFPRFPGAWHTHAPSQVFAAIARTEPALKCR
jgi:hypothetical protein